MAHGAAFAAVLAYGAALRFWDLSTRPGWQFDEDVYSRLASNLLYHGLISEHITYGATWSPDLYEPPYYAIILARWFALTGDSISHARVLGVLCSLGTLITLWRLLSRIHGPGAALFAVIPITFDGWLLYVQRISYIENMLLLLVTAGLLCYQRALDRPSWWRFAAAGGLLGGAVAFKYTGCYVIGTVLLSWLIERREHRGHLVLLGSALAVLGSSILLQIRWFDVPGHDWFIQETLVQVRRVLALQPSGGTLTSPVSALHLLLAQYKVFVPSVVIAISAAAMALRRLWRCYRQRAWDPVRGNALLLSWMSAGVVVFGLSSLRFPQYFALILVPAYAFFWTEARQWNWRWRAIVGAQRGGLPGRSAVVLGTDRGARRQRVRAGPAIRRQFDPRPRGGGRGRGDRRPDRPALLPGTAGRSVPRGCLVRDHLGHLPAEHLAAR